MQPVGSFERVLRFEGGRNFRDLGGYATRDGRSLKWGRLYRSGSMAGLTPADYQRLGGMGVRVICDLRSNAEREAGPVDWRCVPNLSYWARDYDMSFGDLRSVMSDELANADAARRVMTRVYRELPFEQAPAYAELFRRLSAGDVPLVFNCSAGKDRTGVAAALVLSALGVAEGTVVEDYLMSNVTFTLAGSPAEAMISRLDPEVVGAVMGVKQDYIAAAFAAIDEAHGSVQGYLRDRLGVTTDALRSLEALLLE